MPLRSFPKPHNTQFVYQDQVAALVLREETVVIPLSYEVLESLGSRYAMASTCNRTNVRHILIIIDTGTSISICCCIDAFIRDLCLSGATTQGIRNFLAVDGIGTVGWTVFDINT